MSTATQRNALRALLRLMILGLAQIAAMFVAALLYVCGAGPRVIMAAMAALAVAGIALARRAVR